MSAPATATATAADRLQAILKDNEALFSAIGILSKKNGALQRNTSTKISDDDILAFYEWYMTVVNSGNNAVQPPCAPGILPILKLWKARLSASIENTRVSNAARGTVKVTKDMLDKWIRLGESTPVCAPAPTAEAAVSATAPVAAGAVFDPAAIVAPILEKLEEIQRSASACDGPIPPAVDSMIRNATSVRSAEDLESVLKDIQTTIEKQPVELKEEIASALRELKDPVDVKLDALKTELETVKSDVLAALQGIPALQTNVQSRFAAMQAAPTLADIQDIADAMKKDLGADHAELFQNIQTLLTTADFAKTRNVTDARDTLQADLKDIRSDLSEIKQVIQNDTVRDRMQSQLDKLVALQEASAGSGARGADGPLAASIASIQSILDDLSKKAESGDATLRAAYEDIARLKESLETKQATAVAAAVASNTAHAAEIADLTAQIEAKAAELDQLRAAATQVSPNSAKQSIQALESAVSEKNTRIAELEAVLEDLRQQSEAARMRADAAEAAAAAEADTAALRQRLEEERTALAQRLATTTAQLEEERAGHVGNTDRIADLERSLAASSAAREQIEKDLQALKQESATAATAAAAKAEENRAARNVAYTDEIKTLQTKLSELGASANTAGADAEARIRELETELRECRDAAAATKERERSDAEFEKEFQKFQTASSAELERARAALAVAESQRAKSVADAETAQQELRAVRSELETVAARAEAAETALASAKPDMLSTKADLTKTQTALADAEKDVKNRDAYYRRIHPKLLQYSIETFSPDKDYTQGIATATTQSAADVAASGRRLGTGAPTPTRYQTALETRFGAPPGGRGGKSRRSRAVLENSRRITRRRARRLEE
jgi:chromosome segregation ATPase